METSRREKKHASQRKGCCRAGEEKPGMPSSYCQKSCVYDECITTNVWKLFSLSRFLKKR